MSSYVTFDSFIHVCLLQDLQDFLDIYYEACSVLQKEEDFYDLMYSYLRQASVDNVYVAEIFFDPQTHTERGVPFDVVMSGLHRALTDGYMHFSIKGSLIMCFLRHLSEESALNTLESAKPHMDKIIGVGLDSGELGNPPRKFASVYKMASSLGLKLVAHAGEEGGPENIHEALDMLGVLRIDHGVQCLKDDKLVERLVREGVPLTTCPLSNEKLQVYSHFFNGRNVTKDMLDKGLKVTINSDDPAYFGGYITANFLTAARECALTERDIYKICRNSFNASFLPRAEKEYYLQEIEHINVAMGYSAPTRSITIFGSRGSQPGSEAYKVCAKLAKNFASLGYRVVNGGYSGLMEASSKGGREGGAGQAQQGGSCAGTVLGILAPRVFSGRHHHGNQYLTHNVIARNLSDRIRQTLRMSEYCVVFGGTIGTVTELFVAWNTATVRPNYGGIPNKIYVWRPFWETCLREFYTTVGIFTADVALLTFFDSVEEVLELVEKDFADRVSKASL